MFNYDEAFKRNLGWVTPAEQDKIKNFKIGIIGAGGVGGHHLHCLIRMGFRRFKISDLDQFDQGNFNRQFGSMMSTVGRDKVDVIREIALDINPDCEIEVFDKGIDESNMESFLEGLDVVCDGLDVFALDIRVPIYERAHQKGITVISAGPFGLGSSVMAFSPKGMSFNRYFNLDSKMDLASKLARFLVGLSPRLLHVKYLVAKDQMNIYEGKVPSLHGGVYAASALMGANIFKLAVGRGKVFYAPYSFQFDFYRMKMKKSWMPFGNRNPIQRIIIFFAQKIIEKKQKSS